MRTSDPTVISRDDPSVPLTQALAPSAFPFCDARLATLDVGTLLAMEGSDIPPNWLGPAHSMVRLLPRIRTDLLPPPQALPQVLAEFSTEPSPGYPVEGRWTRLRITQTGGEYLCEKTRGPDPVEERSATVPSLESAKAFFGGGWVVKELFAKLDPQRFPRWP
jgi:hypothetical protein